MMSTSPDLSRRALFFGHDVAAIPLRPPWASSESDFNDACTACGACIERCPQHVLVRGAGSYPVFDPQLGECTFCGECADVCTPRALDRKSAEVPWKQLAVIGDACLAMRGVVCSSCRDACPERAIGFPLVASVAMPSMDDNCCSGCGACVSVCPVAAIAVHSSD